jgi:GntR family transcriptional regulator
LVSRQGLGIFVAEPRAELTLEAREQRLLQPLDRWLTLAVHLGYSQEEVLQLVGSRVLQFQWNSQTNPVA